MYVRKSLPAILMTAVQRAFANLTVLLPFCLLIGGGCALLMWKVGMMMGASGSGGQSDMIASELSKLGVQWVWGILFYPLIDAVAIYIWRRSDRGESVGLGGAFNWALNRYGRMFVPHAVAFSLIYVGVALIIPGIYFGLMYPFTDAISATDPKAKRPLKRSEKLVVGRQQRILFSWLPYVCWYVPAGLWLIHVAAGHGFWAVVAFGTLDLFLLQIMEMVMYALYEERIEEAYAAREARLKAQAHKEGEAASAEPSAGDAGDEPSSSPAEDEGEAQASAEESPQLGKDASQEAPD